MSIASAILAKQQQVADAYTAISNKGGTLPATQDLSNMPNAINTISTGGTINSLNVTPSTSAQTITASGGVDGYSPVNVSAVTASIDQNIQAKYIRNGVEILGITGSYGDPVPVKIYCTDYTTWYNGLALYGCGRNNYGQQGSGSTSDVTTFTKRADNVVQVACANNASDGGTTWYINENGELYGCGLNNYGQQGNGTSGTNVLTFTKKADNVIKIICAYNATWYINENGELYGCGRNYSGQQGSGDTTNVLTFTKRADNVVQVVCSNNTTWYINENGELYGCGKKTGGNQGSGDYSGNITTFTKRADNVVQVVCSDASTQNTTWYINENGELYGCGSGDYGQQGDGNSGLNKRVLTFTKRATNVKYVACSGFTTWYINENGELYGCGRNNYGQQGSGSTSDVTTFTKRADNVVFVCCSTNTTWYINESGELYGCGRNYSGQQGSGDTTNVLTFTKRADNVVQVDIPKNNPSTSGFTTWYVNASNEVYGCGSNSYGQQGSGTSGSGTDVLTFTKRN